MAFSKWVLIIATAIVGLGFLISMLILRRNRTAVSEIPFKINPKAIPTEGIRIPVLRTYSGLKRLAPVTFIENKIFPRLVLFDGHFDYQVLGKRSVRYDNIEAVHSYTSKYYNKLRFDFNHSGVFFMVVFANQETLYSVLDFLTNKGIYTQTGN
jgi:hypothetical protein